MSKWLLVKLVFLEVTGHEPNIRARRNRHTSFTNGRRNSLDRRSRTSPHAKMPGALVSRREGSRDANRAPIRSAQKVGDAVRLVGAPGVERRLPDRDLAVAHHPDFDAKAAHGGAALGVLPFALPDVGDGVVRQRAEAFLEPVALLL